MKQTITLYSILPKHRYMQLQAEGSITGNAAYVEPDFLPAYRWLIGFMPPKPAHMRQMHDAMPVWSWYQCHGVNKKKPDLRHSGFLPKGTEAVLLTLKKQRAEVLLSDYQLWHYALNGWYLPSSLADGARFEKNRAALGDGISENLSDNEPDNKPDKKSDALYQQKNVGTHLSDLLGLSELSSLPELLSLPALLTVPAALRLTVIASWQRVFALDWYAQGVTDALAEKNIQATCWAIHLHDVTAAKAFVAR